MKETGVLFNTTMVRAEREGRKDQTRRLDGLKKVNESPDDWEVFDIFVTETASRAKNAHDVTVASLKNKKTNIASLFECPFGVVGDVLWVRETWAIKDCGHRVSLKPEAWPDGFPIDRVQYIATDKAPSTEEALEDRRGSANIHTDIPYWWNKRPSIHMPRWACRTVLEITDIRVERVQGINAEDAMAEGILYHDGLGVGHSGYRHSIDHGYVYETAQRAFHILWDSVYKKRGLGWDKNPWVWVITFKRMVG
jgi:hypothetical protein